MKYFRRFRSKCRPWPEPGTAFVDGLKRPALPAAFFESALLPEFCPLIHKVFTRGVLALSAAELVHFFAPAGWPLARFSNLAFFLAALFLLGTLIAWLRLDGMSIPQLSCHC